MATFTDISQLEDYEIPASGETIVLEIDENYYGAYELYALGVQSFTAVDGNYAGTVDTDYVNGIFSFYGLGGNGESVTITFVVGANSDQSLINDSIVFYDTEGEPVGDYSFYQAAASAKRKYITTNGGNGYFDLGSITINSNTLIKFKATPRTAADGFWFGYWNSYAESYGIYHPVQNAENNRIKWYSLGSEGVVYSGSSINDILDHSFEIEMNTTYVKVNGTTVTRNAPINKTYSAFRLGMAVNPSYYDGKKPVEWEYFQIYNGETLTLDLVPAYKNNQYCFYDRVSLSYLYGTGTISGEVTTFIVNTNAIYADYSGTSSSVTVTADSGLTWTASTSDSWISLTNPTGSSNGSFTVVVSENRAHSAKTGTVTVTSSEGDVLTISVSQEKAPSLVSQKPLYRNGDSVIKMYRSGELIYLKVNPQTTPPTPTGYTDMPLTFEITKAGNLKWYTQNGSYTKTIEYKKNDGEWTHITSSNAGTLIPVEVGDIVQLRGDNAQYAPQDGRCSCWCGTTANYKMYGNIMSLIDSTGFTSLSSFTADNVFMNFFNSGGCIDAENLILPATALTYQCYQGMLAQSANLQVGPLLPVETLVGRCYAYMFYHSYQINNIRCLATNISASQCLQEWVNGAPSSGTFYKNPNMSSWGSGSSGIPSNWTVLDYTE